MFVALGLFISHKVASKPWYHEWNYPLYGKLTTIGPRQPYAEHTLAVVIDDNDYWHGALEARSPLNRAYLASLITKLSECNPGVLALDIDLRSPDPAGKITSPVPGQPHAVPDHPSYAEETWKLLEAIRKAAKRCPVVLPRTIRYSDEYDPHGSAAPTYATEHDIYDGFDFGSQDVHTGYIALDDDLRVVPRELPLETDAMLDSFSLAIVRAFRPQALAEYEVSSEHLASFLKEGAIPELSAGQLLAANSNQLAELSKQIRGRSVIIGGDWHRLGPGRGPRVDSYTTPAGLQSGALIHANYVEALLDHRTFPRWKFLALIIDIGLAYGLAYLLRRKLDWYKKAALIVGLFILPVAGAYFLLHNLGVVLDVLVVLGLLLTHLMVEKITEWYLDHRKLLDLGLSDSS